MSYQHAAPPSTQYKLGLVIAEQWQRLRDREVVLLDGFHAVKHALRFGAEVLSVITVDRAAALGMAEVLAPDLAGMLAARLAEVDAATFARLSGHRTGVAALARRAPWSLGPLVAHRRSPLVFLDGPRHLGNYGAVVRVAAGLGAAGVVSTGTVDPWHPAVLRGAAGLHYAVPVLRLDEGLPGAVEGPLLAFDAAGADARAATITSNAVLAFGSERHGLSPEVRARADRLLALPMRPGVASYNLASAVAMVLYQWLLGVGGPIGPAAPPLEEHQP
ncbi:MAG TPA: TrmH family RNA methyltransferase [Pseudonocardiaceae bacterium]|jgi:TrmH family RNA methyltransferase